MKILIISDIISKTNESDENKYIHWDEKMPTYIGNNDAVVIDFSLINNERFHIIKDNVLLLESILTPKVIDEDNMIILVVCGSRNDKYYERIKEKLNDDEFQERSEEKYYYDFLKLIIPEYDLRMHFIDPEAIFYPLSIKQISVRHYLESSLNYYLFFRYNQDSVSCTNIIPLAKTKKTSNACIAFEHHIGKGIIIVLPSYDTDSLEEAKHALIKICRGYFKIREECEELELDFPVPKEIKDIYTQAVICYLNDLYMPSGVMSGKTIEALLAMIGAKGENFYKKIKHLESLNILYPKTINLINEIRATRNECAHEAIDEILKGNEKKVDEELIRKLLLFIKHVLIDVLPIEETKNLILKEGKIERSNKDE